MQYIHQDVREYFEKQIWHSCSAQQNEQKWHPTYLGRNSGALRNVFLYELQHTVIDSITAVVGNEKCCHTFMIA